MDQTTARSPERLPEPPWRLGAGAAPRTPITRQSIIEAAFRVLDREGMDRLSMRRVADELGTGAASLYWHVRNKDELLQLLFERVTENLKLPEPNPDEWRAQILEVARGMRRVLSEHRDIGRISLGRIPSGPTVARFIEWLFELLQPIGVPDNVIAYMSDVLSLYIGAQSFEDSLGLQSPTGEDLPPEEIISMLKAYVLSLPNEEFARTQDAIDSVFGGAPDERFEFAIDLLIRGIGTHAKR
jgi:AcrR family transcriptional regulator